MRCGSLRVGDFGVVEKDLQNLVKLNWGPVYLDNQGTLGGEWCDFWTNLFSSWLTLRYLQFNAPHALRRLMRLKRTSTQGIRSDHYLGFYFLPIVELLDRNENRKIDTECPEKFVALVSVVVAAIGCLKKYGLEYLLETPSDHAVETFQKRFERQKAFLRQIGCTHISLLQAGKMRRFYMHGARSGNENRKDPAPVTSSKSKFHTNTACIISISKNSDSSFSSVLQKGRGRQNTAFTNSEGEITQMSPCELELSASRICEMVAAMSGRL